MSVNVDTDFSRAPPVELGHVIKDGLLRAVFLRQEFGQSARVVFSKIDISTAHRQFPINPQGAPMFGYIVDNNATIDLRQQFW